MNRPNIASLIALSDLYQISLDELVKGDPKMEKKLVKDANNQAILKHEIRFMLISTLIIGGVYFISLAVGGAFHDFWQAAMPYILMAVLLAGHFAYQGKKMEDENDSNGEMYEEEQKKDES